MRVFVDMWEGYHHPSASAVAAAATAPLPPSVADPAYPVVPAASPTAGVLLRMPRLFPAAAAAAFRATRAVSGSAAAAANDETWERYRVSRQVSDVGW